METAEPATWNNEQYVETPGLCCVQNLAVVVHISTSVSTQEAIPHPMSQEKPDVAASCILLVATVDGVLRLYRLANFEKQQGLARHPQPVPNSLPQNVLHALAAAKSALLEEVRPERKYFLCKLDFVEQ